MSLFSLSRARLLCLPVCLMFWGSAEAAVVVDDRSLSDLQITEIMYHPEEAGDVLDEEFEFIELFNPGTSSADLTGVSFGDGIEYTFPTGSELAAGGYLVLASNAAQFRSRYGFDPFDQYVGRLNNAGERLALLNSIGAVILEVTYDDDQPWPSIADGSGFSIVPVDPFANPDPNDAVNWRASSSRGGSPGSEDAAVRIPRVVVNELLAHTDPPQQDAVELHNPTENTVNIGGWYLTDDASEPKKYRLQQGTTIPPGGYLVLDEEDFNPDPGVDPSFGFSALGDAVYLYSANEAGELTGYRHGFTFGASENQVSFGRYVNSVGHERFVRQRALTFGQENAGPRSAPVVISEIMYHPLDGSDEFIELVNATDGSIPLYDPTAPENTWQVDGIAYALPEGVELPGGGVLLIVPVEPNLFRGRYDVPPSVQIVGPYTGMLNNAGEELRLEKPDPTNQDDTVPYVAVDVVRYDDEAPWPLEADGGGRSLVREDLNAFADDPQAWRASEQAGGSPGNVLPTYLPPRPQPSETVLCALEQPHPNPFRSSARINVRVDKTQEARVEVYDVLGRRVDVLMAASLPGQQTRRLILDGGDLQSGAYVVRLTTEDCTTSRPVILIK